jgi:hypothetical protein
LISIKYIITFALETKKISELMFDFTQYLGFMLFLTILTVGFWLMFFLVGFVQYWLFGAVRELIKEKKAEKAAANS